MKKKKLKKKSYEDLAEQFLTMRLGLQKLHSARARFGEVWCKECSTDDYIRSWPCDTYLLIYPGMRRIENK